MHFKNCKWPTNKSLIHCGAGRDDTTVEYNHGTYSLLF
jgi:hypothetical protein